MLAAVVVAGGAWLVGLDAAGVGLCTGWTLLEAGASGLDAAADFEGAAGAADEEELAGGFAGDSLPPPQLLERPWRAELDVMVWTLVPQFAYWARWTLLPVRSKTAVWC